MLTDCIFQRPKSHAARCRHQAHIVVCSFGVHSHQGPTNGPGMACRPFMSASPFVHWLPCAVYPCFVMTNYQLGDKMEPGDDPNINSCHPNSASAALRALSPDLHVRSPTNIGDAPCEQPRPTMSSTGRDATFELACVARSQAQVASVNNDDSSDRITHHRDLNSR